MAESSSILNLSTTDFDRPRVVIDGESYEMRAADELSVPFIRRMTDLGKQIQDAKEDIEAVAGLIAESVDIVMVELPATVNAALTLGQQAKIVRAFTTLIGDDKPVSPTS